MKYYVIAIGKTTYFRYGGNTRDIGIATMFYTGEEDIMQRVIANYKFKSARIVEIK